jgi:hypothetical protein
MEVLQHVATLSPLHVE